MFTCTACLRRAFASTANHALRPHKIPTTLKPFHASTQSRAPHISTYAEAGALAETTGKDATPEQGSENPGVPRLPRVSKSQEWAAEKQLQYLKDPLHIAEYVHKTLGKDHFEEAALVARKASKNTNVAVSWNHLIDYQMRHDKLHAAIKLYNEMKKRAQLPNAQTFTIIFRGLASSSHSKLAVSEAVKIYNTMLASTSRLKPNTIHMNAVLQVCAKAKDIESMFSVAETANDGLRAPNGLTYTTIFNGLRSAAETSARSSLLDLEVRRAKTQAIQRAKAVWEEVLSKWRAGSLIIDEELVCAMGRVLLMGDYHDANSVEALVKQTMMISLDSKPEALKSPEEVKSLNRPNADIPPPLQVDKQKIKAPGAPTISHALPGNNSLSMILVALEKTGKTTNVQQYWYIFTEKRGVVPDADNWHRLLTALQRGKNSWRTALYLGNMPSELMVPKNFRTAMATCLRDNLNHSAFDHATTVLKIMTAKLPNPDVMVLQTYLRVAYASKLCTRKQKKMQDAMTAWGMQLVTAIDNLWKPYMMLTRQYENDGAESDSKQQLMTLARKMIAACDRVIFSTRVPADVKEQMKPKRNRLNGVVVRHFEQMKEIHPNYRPEDEEVEDDEDFMGRFQQRRSMSEKHPAAESR
ncbi:hypothetical protein F4820DRAFT_417102 [Hypoxylon rubiginosum]|uniref:Uncharacterized protein n=1 Tax=Hypoxylon rubiginosum TaxID=110542 RepID=A0ACB9Z4T3_9PEZI|nr:hypothetical protein F4820DRAFT_417102 [Hypoxylon rubiginosum]